MTEAPRVRVIDGRVYIRLGGAEHGMSIAECDALVREIGEVLVSGDPLPAPHCREFGCGWFTACFKPGCPGRPGEP